MAYIFQQSIGSQVFRFEECSSTNDVMRNLSEINTAHHGAVVMSNFQTHGRGQAGNIWESISQKNIMLSVLVMPPSILADEQVYLNLFACLSVFDFVNAYFPNQTKIKWPNDIYVNDKKIAGLLIENSIQGTSIKNSIIGIGININQQQFENAHAISFSVLLKKDIELDTCRNELLVFLNKRYEELSLHLKYKLMNDYLNVLYKKEVKSMFKVGNEMLEGEIIGIDNFGRLKLKVENEIKLFAFK